MKTEAPALVTLAELQTLLAQSDELLAAAIADLEQLPAYFEAARHLNQRLARYREQQATRQLAGWRR